MSAPESRPRIAAVIATCDRFQLLARRSLPSVVTQTRRPDLLVVVDDSSPRISADNAELLEALALPDCEIAYIQNKRTKGASGAWNTALDFLVGKPENPNDMLVAFLDDDDSWSSEYLETCCNTVRELQLDMLAADLRRFESVNGPPLLIEGPSKLCAEDFLIGNPGIQGSNLFIRLSILLAVGGFDEALRSTTDRDLCIRIADLGTVLYGRLPAPLVNHYAEQKRLRLSTRGSDAKIEGLTAFWRKHVGRMTPDQKAAFSQRATTLFGWHPPHEETTAHSYTHAPRKLWITESINAGTSSETIAKAPAHKPLRLYLGIISSDPTTLKPLLHDLTSIRGNDVEELAVLILDNGSPKAQLDAAVREVRNAGLAVAVLDEENQRIDAAKGAFGKAFSDRPHGQVGIAQARTMLQRYLGELLATDSGSFGWLLDDDMRLDARTREFLPWLPEFRRQGTDVLIGSYEGSSPNPPLNGLRVQLVDLLHNLHWLRSLPSDAPLPDRSAENTALRARYPDYYYDLSRKHTGHLEMPHWLEPVVPGETAKEAYSRLLTGAIDILSGNPLTRPIVVAMPHAPLASSIESVNRGGNTFILNHLALTQTPNTITRALGRNVRRSDMVWAIVNRYYRRMSIKAVGFPVQHLGRVTATPDLNVRKVQDEIIGSTLYAGLTDFLRTRPQHQLDFSPQEAGKIRRLADSHLGRRWQILGLSFHRIAGLRETIRRLARPGELEDLIGYLDRWFTQQSFNHIRSGIATHDSSEVETFLTSLRVVADDFSAATVKVNFIRAQLMAECAADVRC